MPRPFYSGNVQNNENVPSKAVENQNIPKGDTASAENSQKITSKVFNSIGKYVPSSNLGVMIAIISLCLTSLITCCVACSRCRKRGKGKYYFLVLLYASYQTLSIIIVLPKYQSLTKSRISSSYSRQS